MKRFKRLLGVMWFSPRFGGVFHAKIMLLAFFLLVYIPFWHSREVWSVFGVLFKGLEKDTASQPHARQHFMSRKPYREGCASTNGHTRHPKIVRTKMRLYRRPYMWTLICYSAYSRCAASQEPAQLVQRAVRTWHASV